MRLVKRIALWALLHKTSGKTGSLNSIKENDMNIGETDSNMIDVNILGLNVCGLKKKVDYGILEKYIQDFDIICLSETKTDNVDARIFPGYRALCKPKGCKNHPFGGIHGIMILYKEQFDKNVCIINDLTSECVL